MEVVTVSPKYQVVIPKKVRKALKITPGQKVRVVVYENRIQMIPIVPMKATRGFVKGIDTNVERESDRV